MNIPPARPAEAAAAIPESVATILEAIDATAARADEAQPPGSDLSFGRAEGRMETRMLPLFAGRVLPFDLECCPAYA